MINYLIKLLGENKDYIVLNMILGVVIFGLVLALLIFLIKKLVIAIKSLKPIKFTSVFSSIMSDDAADVLTELISEVNYGHTDIYYKGSMIKGIIENSMERTIPIERVWCAIDSVMPLDVRELVVLGHKVDKFFSIFIVNNGYSEIDNIRVSIQGKSSRFESEILNDEELCDILGCDNNQLQFNIQHLDVGEIQCVANYEVSLEKLKSQGNNWVYISKTVEYDHMVENHKKFLASLTVNNNQLEVVYCQGGSPDVIRYQIEVDSDDEYPKKKELDCRSNINAGGCLQMQIALYVNRSSVIEYRFEIKPSKRKVVVSPAGVVQITVPIYQTDGGYFHALREWIVNNKITSYKLNDNPSLQKDILYKIPKSK